LRTGDEYTQRVLRVIYAALCIYALAAACRCESQKVRVEKFDLNTDPTIARRCDPHDGVYVDWLDDTQLLVRYTLPPCTLGSLNFGYSVVGLNGKVLASTDRDGMHYSLHVGPAGRILADGPKGQLALLNDKFSLIQKIPCNVKGCVSYVSADRTGLAVCQRGESEHCEYYTGADLATATSKDFPRGFPYLHNLEQGAGKLDTYSVGNGESWYFDKKAHLFSKTKAGVSPLPDPGWLKINEGCSGEISAESANRFLASCSGGIVIGQEGVLYAYRRLAWYDVNSKKLLRALNPGTSMVSAAISPDGKRIAVSEASLFSKSASLTIYDAP
jgi:hypothetical protein